MHERENVVNILFIKQYYKKRRDKEKERNPFSEQFLFERIKRKFLKKEKNMRKTYTKFLKKEEKQPMKRCIYTVYLPKISILRVSITIIRCLLYVCRCTKK